MGSTKRIPIRTIPPAEAVKTWDQVSLGYSREEAIAEARRALAGGDLKRSTAACPFHVDAARLVGAIAGGDFDSAAPVIYESHPFPEVLGMHCHRYCEVALVPGAGPAGPGMSRPEGIEATPYVSALEWAAGRYGVRPAFEAGAPTGKRVAIVGAGSACLMCAWELRRLGHAVDVFDREPLPGGLLQTGYPSFRMNKDVVRKENAPTDWGVTYYPEHTVDAAELRRLIDAYDAVFVGTGRTPLRSFGGVPGEDLEGVLTGMDVLRATWYGHPPAISPRVMVFGGGFSALDVVRTARRLGCEAQLVYRRGMREMLLAGAAPDMTESLKDEGIAIRLMTDLTRIIGEHGKVVAIELVTMEYGEPDASGRRGTHPVPGSEEIVPVDTVIRAIGEIYEIAPVVEPAGIETYGGGFIRIDRVTRQTTHPKVWAGGDVAASRGNDGAAYDGLWAARAMDAAFRGGLDAWRAAVEASGDALILAHHTRA